MKEIAIYGAGGLGREVACLIDRINNETKKWRLIGFFDDGLEKGELISNFGCILGGKNDINNWPTPLDVVICVGNPKTNYSIAKSLDNNLLSFPNIISPDFCIEDINTFCIGNGNIIKSGCKVTTGVSIGNFNIFNGSIVLGHDVTIGNNNVFMPGVKISGEVTIGNRNLFGCMSFVKQCLKIGNDVTLSPLSPLLSKPKDGHTYIGNPAKIFKF